MNIIRPLHISCNQQVLEQDRKFYFTVSASLGIHLQTGETLLDLHYLKDMFDVLGEKSLPDAGMPKPNGEFLVSGSFYAFEGRPVTGGEAGIELGDSSKKLVVFGPRQWTGGFPSAPQPVDRMPIDWANAFGGKDYDRNPDGLGCDDGLLPLIENPDGLVTSAKNRPEPAGFGPLYPIRPQRMQYQGTYDDWYKEKYFPGYPADHDWRYFLCAPDDQWITGYFNGSEHFAIRHMHTDHAKIQGRLPGFRVRCFVNPAPGTGEEFGELPLNLDTVWFFPDKLLALLIFRGVMQVADDEAEEISHLLAAYEDTSCEARSMAYYRKALEKRLEGRDPLSNFLKCHDLIPENHKSPMEILMATAFDKSDDNAFADNMDAKVEDLQRMADEKIEDALQETEKNLDELKIPEKAWEHIPGDAKQHLPGKEGGLDIKKMFRETPETEPDGDAALFKQRLEAAIPGITSGDPKKIDWKVFSFDKIDELMDAVDELAASKEKAAGDRVKKVLEETKEAGTEQIRGIDKQIDKAAAALGTDNEEQLKSLEESREKIRQSLEVMDVDPSDKAKAPLPRLDAEAMIKKLPPPVVPPDPKIMETLHQIQSMKAMGMESDRLKELEADLQNLLDQSQKELEASLESATSSIRESEQGFKDVYITTAHFMDDGLSPHKEDPTVVRDRFLDRVSLGKSVAGQDWSCINLSGQNLDGLDLSGGFFEQTDFSGTSLKGADLSRAILARACLENADLTGANLEGANVGGVRAARCNFTKTNLSSAKLSRGDFTQADFTEADLEDIESLEIIFDRAVFRQTRMPRLIFLEIGISGAVFEGAELSSSIFIKSRVEDCDFSGSLMQNCAFIDSRLKNSRFEKADLSRACFAATEQGSTVMENMIFRHACLAQANFQNMNMKKTDLSHSVMENAFFGGTDLTESDLSHAQAKNAQFRKAKLKRARLDHINLDQGSLAKAHLTGASFRGANLHSVDFLRATITDTDFSGSNLDTTLIENWRPG